MAELDDDSDAGHAAAGDRGADPPYDPGGPRGSGAGDRGRPHRTSTLGLVLVVGAVLLACGVAVSFVVGQATEGDRADRVAAQVGGLRPVADDPGPVWRAPAGNGRPAATEGQVVLVGSDGVVTARDVTTGQEVWTADLPAGRTTCGPDLFDPQAPRSPLVCVTARGAATEPGRPDDGSPLLVTVLDGSGRTLGARGLAGRTDAAAPLAGGRVATAVHQDGEVVVTWESALDGAVEQVRTVRTRDDAPDPVDAVGGWGDPGARTATVTDGRVELVAARGMLHVRSDDSSATFDAAGEPVVERERSAQRRGWLAPGALPGGRSATVVEDRGTDREDRVEVSEPEGRGGFALAGEPFLPEVTDGTVPEVLVLRMPGFTGYDASTGRMLWHREEWPEVHWLQTADVVVVESGSRLLAFESGSGRGLWQRWLSTEIVRAFTDGDSLLLATVGDRTGETGESGTASTTVLSVNLIDGRLEWRRTLDGPDQDVGAVQGLLVAVSGTEVVRLGRRRTGAKWET